MKVASINQTAMSATLHCLTGCAIGEIAGLILGAAFGWSNLVTFIVAVSLAFAFGYSLSVWPLLTVGIPLATAFGTVFAADTLSIATMEIVDNLAMAVIPGAMEAGIVDPRFWLSMSAALFIAFWAAFPVNRYLLQRGQGHALMHKFHDHGNESSHEHHRTHGHGSHHMHH